MGRSRNQMTVGSGRSPEGQRRKHGSPEGLRRKHGSPEGRRRKYRSPRGWRKWADDSPGSRCSPRGLCKGTGDRGNPRRRSGAARGAALAGGWLARAVQSTRVACAGCAVRAGGRRGRGGALQGRGGTPGEEMVAYSRRPDQGDQTLTLGEWL